MRNMAVHIPEAVFLLLLLAFLAWVGYGEYLWNKEIAYYCPNASSIFSMTFN